MLQGLRYTIYVLLVPTSPNFQSVLLRSLIFQIIEVLVSPWATMVNSEFLKKKMQKIVISKFKRKSETQFCEDQWEERSGGFKSFGCNLQEEQRFEFLAPIGSHVNQNKSPQIVKISIFKISKVPNVVLCGPLGRKLRMSLTTFGCDLYGTPFEILTPTGSHVSENEKKYS